MSHLRVTGMKVPLCRFAHCVVSFADSLARDLGRISKSLSASVCEPAAKLAAAPPLQFFSVISNAIVAVPVCWSMSYEYLAPVPL